MPNMFRGIVTRPALELKYKDDPLPGYASRTYSGVKRIVYATNARRDGFWFDNRTTCGSLIVATEHDPLDLNAKHSSVRV
jgi:hypothetical protein